MYSELLGGHRDELHMPLGMQVVYAVLFNGWIVLLVSNVGEPGLWAIAWVLYLAFTTHMAYERGNLRTLRVSSFCFSLCLRVLCSDAPFAAAAAACLLRCACNLCVW